MTFDVIVAVYNTPLCDVPAVRSFSGIDGVVVYACDNSADEGIRRRNADLAAGLRGVRHIDMGGNAGLARAYNAAVAAGGGDVVCVFDDDTEPPANYLGAMSVAVEEGGSGCYVPLVRGGKALLSPLRRKGPAIMRVEDPLSIPPEGIYAFNTGMAVTRGVYRLASYDEGLFVDYVDHSYVRELHRRGVPVRVVPGVELRQDYSRETDDLESALRRDATFRRDVRRFHAGGGRLEALYGEAYLLYRLVRNTLHYRTARFVTLREAVGERGEEKRLGLHGDVPRGGVCR